jgi:hypothetical protein
VRFALVLMLFAVAGCRKPPPPPPVWPSDLTFGWTWVQLKEGQQQYSAIRKGGTWVLEAPYRGDADPDTIDRLASTLVHPLVLASGPPGAIDPNDLTITLLADRKAWRLNVQKRVLGAPVVVDIEGLGEFTLSPVEISNKLPKPEELLSAGLWVAAERHARTLSVTGPVSYELAGQGEDWEVRDGGQAARDLDIPPGTISGRQAIGHPSGSLESLGLKPPIARARLCTEHECREFAFGSASGDGGTHFYAVAPDSDPVELRASDWKAVVNGPFK